MGGEGDWRSGGDERDGLALAADDEAGGLIVIIDSEVVTVV